ncbi:MAG TPA: hemerythrin domain-containing protein [Actinospica sp.]|nr:hemerythrin domain-containing protein [Actinospica sp.]
MHTAREERMAAASLPQANVVSILYEQHAQLRDQFGVVPDLHGEYRRAAFDMLREMLARHEAAEEVVLRPVTEKLLPSGQTHARNDEEKAAARELAELERMDLESPEFAPRLRLLEEQVLMHFVREEAEEFPAVLGELSAHEQEQMGRWMMRAMALAPSHPHPMLTGSPVGQAVLGPFAALSDWARDLLGRSREEHREEH